jgi:hypothetical protein
MDLPFATAEADIEGLTLRALFHTDELTLTADLLTADTRLSDVLNSSLPTVEVRPLQVRWNRGGSSVDLDSPHALMEKDHILFVIPVTEPSRPSHGSTANWRSMSTLPCWASLGPYTLTGTVHVDANRDPRVALRLLDKQFVPLTDVSLTTAGGDAREYSTIVINRKRIDMLALLSLGETKSRW